MFKSAEYMLAVMSVADRLSEHSFHFVNSNGRLSVLTCVE